MRKKNKKIDIRYQKRKLMLLKVYQFIKDSQKLVPIQSHILWIKRIINFIENELPNLEKYQKTISLLNNLIVNEDQLKYNTIQTRMHVLKILEELVYSQLFDFYDEFMSDFYIDLHPKVKEHSLDLFNDGHYAQAIFEAVKALENFVKRKANITDEYLSKAMVKAFNENNPINKLNELKTRSDKSEQEGFRLLYMGAMKGIRNPKAHDTIKQEDKNRTLEYLAFLSLLFRRAEEGKL